MKPTHQRNIAFKSRAILLTAAASFMFAGTACADQSGFFPSASRILGTYTLDCAYWYAGGNIGLSRLHDKKTPNSANSVDENGPGWSVYGGYRFNALLGLELGYNQYYNSRESIGTGGHGSNIIAKTTHFAAYTALTGRYPLFNKISVIGKLGPAYSYALKEFTGGASASSGSVSAFGGIGFAYSMTRNADIVADWSMVQGNHYTGSAELYTLGMTYGFI
ncbi:hypothetical protein AQUSIP_02070 [Aquicella siphonis]|uniref:Outer membrane protein OmpA-like transmembrane domain-containing protein n=1 Tax=Aquicella siphonis TaxID=254247 RepID=A0A5E4PET2_9COXI|nr:outer membrane beta-barrel protein [Aquicella siphonis]VVC74933.1 hypothetical protein AQUSIP_02070 [Aquicella siphonis]